MSLGLQRPIWAMTIDIPDNEQLIGLWPPCCYHHTCILQHYVAKYLTLFLVCLYLVFKFLKEIIQKWTPTVYEMDPKSVYGRPRADCSSAISAQVSGAACAR